MDTTLLKKDVGFRVAEPNTNQQPSEEMQLGRGGEKFSSERIGEVDYSRHPLGEKATKKASFLCAAERTKNERDSTPRGCRKRHSQRLVIKE